MTDHTDDETNTTGMQDEQRSPDQDAAIEAAFIAGTLPEEDRRAPDAEQDPPPAIVSSSHVTEPPQGHGAGNIQYADLD
jgi:hypothetical protein